MNKDSTPPKTIPPGLGILLILVGIIYFVVSIGSETGITAGAVANAAIPTVFGIVILFRARKKQ